MIIVMIVIMIIIIILIMLIIKANIDSNSHIDISNNNAANTNEARGLDSPRCVYMICYVSIFYMSLDVCIGLCVCRCLFYISL